MLGRGAVRDAALARWILPTCVYISEICDAEQEFRERLAVVVPILWAIAGFAVGRSWGRSFGVEAVAVAATLAAGTAALVDIGADGSSDVFTAIGWVLMCTVPVFVAAVLGAPDRRTRADRH
jgi:hypothetical protein